MSIFGKEKVIPVEVVIDATFDVTKQDSIIMARQMMGFSFYQKIKNATLRHWLKQITEIDPSKNMKAYEDIRSKINGLAEFHNEIKAIASRPLPSEIKKKSLEDEI